MSDHMAPPTRAQRAALSSHLLEEIKALPAKYPQPRSAVMPALDLAQEELGHLTPEAMSEVAGALQLDPGYVEGVATFYTLFHLQPVGQHRFYVCTNLSCTLRGAEAIVHHLRETTGVKEAGEVSKDGLFSYEEVECLGACEYAPVCRLDHRYQVDLTTEKIDALVAERRVAPASRSASAGPPANAPARTSGVKDRPYRSLPDPPPARGGRETSSMPKPAKARKSRAPKKDG